MKPTNLYETIFKRRSIRKYDLTPLDENTLADISTYMSTIKPLDDQINVEMKLVSGKDIKSLLPKAPHYIAVFSEIKAGYLTNVGFMLQQMDLFLSGRGIGSCWQGIPKPTKAIVNNSKLQFIIVLALGKSLETLHRVSVSEFKRKSLNEITNILEMDELLEPARLAPFATGQPWFFTGDQTNIHAYCVQSKIIKVNLFENMNRINMGITMCHIWIAAEHFGKNIEFISDQVAQSNQPAGYYYIGSMRILKK